MVFGVRVHVHQILSITACTLRGIQHLPIHLGCGILCCVIVVLMPRKYNSFSKQRRGLLPTMAQVTEAARVACVITGGDLRALLGGTKPSRMGYKSFNWQKVCHARVYALFALRAIFEDGQVAAMAAMLKSPSAWQYANQMDLQLNSGRLKWWSDHEFMRVIEAVEAFIEMEKVEAAQAYQANAEAAG